MSKLKILIEGYAKDTGNGWLASSTVVLIEDSDKRIIVDPGINKKLLLEKLKEEGLTTDDIDIVFLTHYHLDHVFLASIFDKALVVDSSTIYEEDRETEYEGPIPGTNIEVVPTPGHAHEHCSLLVHIDDLGDVVVGADVVWWLDGEEQDIDREVLFNREDPFTVDAAALRESREKILGIADYIIPGHGKMFKVKHD